MQPRRGGARVWPDTEPDDRRQMLAAALLLAVILLRRETALFALGVGLANLAAAAVSRWQPQRPWPSPWLLAASATRRERLARWVLAGGSTEPSPGALLVRWPLVVVQWLADLAAGRWRLRRRLDAAWAVSRPRGAEPLELAAERGWQELAGAGEPAARLEAAELAGAQAALAFCTGRYAVAAEQAALAGWCLAGCAQTAARQRAAVHLAWLRICALAHDGQVLDAEREASATVGEPGDDHGRWLRPLAEAQIALASGRPELAGERLADLPWADLGDGPEAQYWRRRSAYLRAAAAAAMGDLAAAETIASDPQDGLRPVGIEAGLLLARIRSARGNTAGADLMVRWLLSVTPGTVWHDQALALQAPPT